MDFYSIRRSAVWRLRITTLYCRSGKTPGKPFFQEFMKNSNRPGFEGQKVLAKAFTLRAGAALGEGYQKITKNMGRSTYTMASAASAEPLDYAFRPAALFSGISGRYPPLSDSHCCL